MVVEGHPFSGDLLDQCPYWGGFGGEDLAVDDVDQGAGGLFRARGGLQRDGARDRLVRVHGMGVGEVAQQAQSVALDQDDFQGVRERRDGVMTARGEILDRVGGGDSFASGLIYGLLDGQTLTTAVEYGAAHGALAMTTPGDTCMATKNEVLKLARGGSARVDR